MVRLFIGIMLPESLRDQIILLQNKIKYLLEGKLVEKENLHISLSFLGEVDQNKIASVGAMLDHICSKHEKLQVKLGGLKFIPSLEFLRVVAVEVIGFALKKISEDIRDGIGGDVKPPHLTLCRVRKVIDKEKLIAVSSDGTEFLVDKISLIRSELSGSGPKYTVVHNSGLR